MTIPTILTLVRIVMIPIFVLVFYLPYWWHHIAATAVFSLAAITDWFDGYLARRLDQASDFGAFLDPVADKLMVVVALVLLVEAKPTPWMTVPAMIIIGREIAVSALREWMTSLGNSASVAVNMLGKIKTTAQMTALILLIFHEPIWFIPTELLGYACLYIAASLTLWSMGVYLYSAWQTFQEQT